MNNHLRVQLHTAPHEHERLLALQQLFADACNRLAVTVQQTRCWNRVALHHMAYKSLREDMPQLGSQMTCNVIYAVSRACRAVYQGRGSPFNLQLLGARPLPRVMFEPDAPVYFDKHTLSLRDGRASMFTLDGRLRFDIGLGTAEELRFRTERLREIALSRRNDRFVLDFQFAGADEPASTDDAAAEAGLPTFIRVNEPQPLVAPQLAAQGRGARA